MQTKETHTATRTVNLVDGTFTPTEALDVIQGLIDEKINFHKLQRLSMTEGDCHCNTKYPDGRISELQEEKEHAKEIIFDAYQKGCQIKISGILNIEFIK